MILPVRNIKYNLQYKNKHPDPRLQNKPEFNSSFYFNGNFNLSFGVRCSTTTFKVKDIKNLRCPVCGQIMIKATDRQAFILDVADKKGKKLISALEKYEDESIFLPDGQKSKKRGIYRPNEQEIVDIIKNLAQKHPDFSLAQLVRLQAEDIITKTKEQQNKVFDLARKYTNENIWNSSERNELFKLISKH